MFVLGWLLWGVHFRIIYPFFNGSFQHTCRRSTAKLLNSAGSIRCFNWGQRERRRPWAASLCWDRAPPPHPGKLPPPEAFFFKDPGAVWTTHPTLGGRPWGSILGPFHLDPKKTPTLAGYPLGPTPNPPWGGGGTPPLGNCLQTTSVSTEAGKRCQEGGGRGHLWIPCGHRRLEIHVFLIKKPENKTPFFQVGIFQDCQGLNTGAGLIYF